MAIKITISGDGLNYEGETSITKAAQVIAFLGADHSNLTSTETLHQDLSTNTNTPKLVQSSQSNIAPRQLINEAGAKTNVQKITVIGKYFKNTGQDVFTRSEVVEQFRRAGEILPKNIGRDFKEAVKMGYICESSQQREEYYLTNDGETEISQGFNGAKGFKKNKSRPSKTKSSAAEPSNANLKTITFTPQVEGLPNYWNIKKGDRILWILDVGKSNNISDMTNKDIEYVAKSLDDNIPNSSVNALTGISRKNSYLTKKGTVYTILAPGMKYVEGLINSKQNDEETK